jgi:hypothetical protein
MVQVKAKDLADAVDALEGLSCNVEWRAETHRTYRGYCHPEIEITRRISELEWLRRVLEFTIKGDNQNVLRLEEIKDGGLSEVQPREEYSCDGTSTYRDCWITQDDKGFTRNMQIAGKLFCNANRELGLLLRALGAYGEERGPREVDELVAKAKETWEEYLAYFGQNREQWFGHADEVYYALHEGMEASQELSKAEVQELAELTKAKGISAVATKLKIPRGTLVGWTQGWYSPAKGRLERVRSYLHNRET